MMTSFQNKQTDNGKAAAKKGNGNFFSSVVQPKLAINQPGDKYEQEADAMADKVMRMPAAFVQPDSFFKSVASTVQRKCAHCEAEENLQRKENNENTSTNSEGLDDYVDSLPGKGQSLSADTKGFFESRFGHDFGNVKLHTDSVAAKSAQSINALAYTAGNHIVFNQNQYQPGSETGKKLLAHELTHVVQQNNKAGRMVQRANINYRQLTWADFKGAVPKGADFDAETSSGIEYQNLASVKPTYTETKSEDTCTVKGARGKDVEKPMTEVELKIDSGKIKTRAFMSQEKSWAKAVFKSDFARKQACTTETKDDVEECKKGVAESKKSCEEELNACKETVKSGGGRTFTIGDETFSSKDEAGCKAANKKCNDAVKSTIDDLPIVGEKDCVTNHVAACAKRKKDSADELLKHEQGHFDITNITAKQLETTAKSLIDGLAGKKFKECKKEEAYKKAKAEAKSMKSEIDNLITSVKTELQTSKTTLQETQDRYDSPEEADHSKNVERQDAWNSALAGGKFPDPPEAATP